MSARRAVKDASGAKALAAARARVQDAKVALGERGPKWWTPLDDEALATRARATVFTLLRHRGDEKTICPSDVARSIGGDAWRSRMQLVRSVVEQLASAREVEVRQRGAVVDAKLAKGPIRIALTSRRSGRS